MHSQPFRVLCRVAAPVALALAIASPSAAQPGQVVFSELMWSGSDASSADEWIELYNRGDTSVDLSGWTITRGDGEDEEPMVVIPAGILEPGTAFLIANYKDTDERSRLAVAPQLVDAGISLPNSRLRLHLYDGAPEMGRLIDEADDGSGAPFGGLGGDSHASMVRLAFDMAGNLKQAWGTAEAADGWDAGTSSLGTPGRVAGTALPIGGGTAVTAASWARVKSHP